MLLCNKLRVLRMILVISTSHKIMLNLSNRSSQPDPHLPLLLSLRPSAKTELKMNTWHHNSRRYPRREGKPKVWLRPRAQLVRWITSRRMPREKRMILLTQDRRSPIRLKIERGKKGLPQAEGWVSEWKKKPSKHISGILQQQDRLKSERRAGESWSWRMAEDRQNMELREISRRAAYVSGGPRLQQQC